MKYIIDNINRMAGKYTPHQVFADQVEMSVLSIAQSIEPDEEREESLFSIARKYSEDDFFHTLMLDHEKIDTTMIYAKTDTKSVKYSHDKYM